MRTDPARRAEDDGGFTLIELLVAMTVFAVLASAFALTMGGALRTYGRARARTLAEQLATERLEAARSMDYADVGNPYSDTPGAIPLTSSFTRGGIDFTVKTDVDYVDDAIEGGLRTAANYKRVLVSVSQAATADPLVTMETLLSPSIRPAADKAAVIVEVFDYAPPTPAVPGAIVHLTGGPSAPRDGLTDPDGEVVFAQLDPNPSAATEYAVTVEKAGYVVYQPDLEEASRSLGAGDIFDIDLRMFRPLTLDVSVVDPAGQLIPGTSSVTVSTIWEGQPVTETIPVQSPQFSIIDLFDKPLLPVEYEVYATTPAGTTASVSLALPPGFSGDPILSYTLQTSSFPTVPLDVTVRDEQDDPLAAADVTVTGGPEDISQTLTTDLAGRVTLDVAASATATYEITVTGEPPYGEGSATVPVPGPGGASVEVEVPYLTAPLEVLVHNEQHDPVAGVDVTVTGGPTDIGGTLSTDLAGRVTLDVAATPTATYEITVAPTPPYDGATSIVAVQGPGGASVEIEVPYTTTPLNVLVRDRLTQAALPGFTLEVTGHPAGPFTGSTGSDGALSIDVPLGTHVITVPEQAGYQAATATAVVTGPDIVIDLDPLPVVP